MHGTTGLFDRFVRRAPSRFTPIVISLPATGNYDELEEAVRPQLPDSPFVLVGESFSGPLALRLSTGSRTVGVVLVNSFAVAPLAAWVSYLPWRLVFGLPPPAFLIRRFLTGPMSPDGLIEEIGMALRGTSPRILAARFRSVVRLSAGETSSLPLLYLRGTGDQLITEFYVRRTLALFPHHRRADIAGPHLLLQCAPEASWAAIESFFPPGLGHE